MPTHKCITTNADMEPAVTIMNVAVNINNDIHNFGARIITVHLVFIHTHTARIATWRMYAGPRKRPACIESICPAPMLLETQLGDCALGSPGLSPPRRAAYLHARSPHARATLLRSRSVPLGQNMSQIGRCACARGPPARYLRVPRSKADWTQTSRFRAALFCCLTNPQRPARSAKLPSPPAPRPPAPGPHLPDPQPPATSSQHSAPSPPATSFQPPSPSSQKAPPAPSPQLRAASSRPPAPAPSS